MKPIVKYQGGKGRELPFIRVLKPKDFKMVVEPFAGGAAVSFGLNKHSVLNDTNWNIINLYFVVQSSDYFELQDMVDELKTKKHDDLEKEYYIARDWLNDNSYVEFLKHNLERAYYYIVQRQLCFSGMERYNSDGLFNVPFGHYQSFGCNLSKQHHDFLQNVGLMSKSFEELDYEGRPDAFYFIDPPYLDRLGYGQESEDLHEKLAAKLSICTAPWLLIHNDCEFYRDTYKDYNIITQDFNYAQRFGKDKNHEKADVTHLYITNYDVDTSRLPNKKLTPKETAHFELGLLIQDLELEADNSIISKFTAKQAEYFINILEK